MSAELRRYLVAEHMIGPAVFNFLVNALIAWLAFRHLDVVPMWGQPSIVGDTVGTIFVLTALTVLVATRIVRWHLRTGKAPAEPLPPGSFGLAARLPEGINVRAIVLAVAVTAVVAPVAVGLLAATGLDGMALKPFLFFKAGFAALLSVFVQPVVAIRALVEQRSA